ncbi:hypothetical protein MTO96_024228 [Rhipicephalus appendiculatus]
MRRAPLLKFRFPPHGAASCGGTFLRLVRRRLWRRPHLDAVERNGPLLRACCPATLNVAAHEKHASCPARYEEARKKKNPSRSRNKTGNLRLEGEFPVLLPSSVRRGSRL